MKAEKGEAAGVVRRDPSDDVRLMFGRIARVYDFLNHFLSLGIDRSWRRALARSVKRGPDGRILDLACGTFDSALAAARELPGVKAAAFDFCLPMLERGLGKLGGEEGSRVCPAAADARSLPLRDGAFDCVTMAFGIRNVRPRSAALAEIFRVLAPGGRVCILEFASGRDKIMGGIYNFYLNRVLPRLGAAFSRDDKAYSYLAETIDAFPGAADFALELEQAGFRDAAFRRLTCGVATLHTAEKPL